jgi:SAM-dependent methyltransferase
MVDKAVNPQSASCHLLTANQMPPATFKESVGCPVCQSHIHKMISRLGGKELKKCLHCQACFVFPLPSSDAVTASFEDSAALDESALESGFRRNRERVLSRIAEYIQGRKQEGSILDVGCFTGLFLKRFFNKPGWQAWGVELSRRAAEKAAENGVRVHAGKIQCAGIVEDSFDIVSVLDAFYYFPKPQSELAEFRRVLKSDGMLILELPFASSRIWRTSTRLGRLLSGAKIHLLQSSDHLFYYTPKSISHLLESCGFRVEAILPLPGNEQVQLYSNIIYKVYAYLALGLYYLSRSRILVTPRFMVVATKTL